MLNRFWVLRLLIGLMCIGFAYMLGRNLVLRIPRKRGTGPASWTLRTLIAAVAVSWRVGIDWLSLLVYGASAVSFSLGIYRARKPPKPPEDLSRLLLPSDEPNSRQLPYDEDNRRDA